MMPTEPGINRSTLGSTDINACDTGWWICHAKSFDALATGRIDSLFSRAVCTNGFGRFPHGTECLCGCDSGVDVADSVPVASGTVALAFDSTGLAKTSLSTASEGN